MNPRRASKPITSAADRPPGSGSRVPASTSGGSPSVAAWIGSRTDGPSPRTASIKASRCAADRAVAPIDKAQARSPSGSIQISSPTASMGRIRSESSRVSSSRTRRLDELRSRPSRELTRLAIPSRTELRAATNPTSRRRPSSKCRIASTRASRTTFKATPCGSDDFAAGWRSGGADGRGWYVTMGQPTRSPSRSINPRPRSRARGPRARASITSSAACRSSLTRTSSSSGSPTRRSSA